MQKTTTSAEKSAIYRQNLRENGWREALFQLPDEVIEYIDEIKERQGLRSRSYALLQLIQKGREQTTT